MGRHGLCVFRALWAIRISAESVRLIEHLRVSGLPRRNEEIR